MVADSPEPLLVHRPARRLSLLLFHRGSTGFVLCLAGDLAAVRRFVLVVMATFIVCYLVFLFFPVAGPYYQFPRPAAWFTDNLPARLAYQALASGSSYGAAFPSSHVAAAWRPPWPRRVSRGGSV